MNKILFPVLLSTFALTSCEEEPLPAEQPIAVVSVAIDEPSHSIALTVSDTKTLSAKVLPDDATHKEVVWESTDPSIASVSAEGVLTAVKAGTTTVRVKAAQAHSVVDERQVVVTDKVIPVANVTLTPNTLSLELDQTTPLIVTLTPANATNRAVQWSSSDPTIASVSRTGNVTGLKLGSATITVTADADGEKFATCNVVVTAKSIPATDMWMKTTKLELKVSDSRPLTAATIPTNATDQRMEWSSDNEAVATVSPAGIVTGIAAGVTTVWVKWGANASIKDKCTVTVLASSAYAVGDLYPNANDPVGVVFWKDPTNPAKGKVVSLTETRTEWAKEKVQRHATDPNSGVINMNIIRAIDGWQTLYPAFSWCAAKGEGWYLPATSEMKAIYVARQAINATIATTQAAGAVPLDENKDYWTSTESNVSPLTNGVTIQFYKGFGGGGAPAGGVSFGSKDGQNNTRAIFAF